MEEHKEADNMKEDKDHYNRLKPTKKSSDHDANTRKTTEAGH